MHPIWPRFPNQWFHVLFLHSVNGKFGREACPAIEKVTDRKLYPLNCLGFVPNRWGAIDCRPTKNDQQLVADDDRIRLLEIQFNATWTVLVSKGDSNSSYRFWKLSNCISSLLIFNDNSDHQCVSTGLEDKNQVSIVSSLHQSNCILFQTTSSVAVSGFSFRSKDAYNLDHEIPLP